MVTLDGPKAKKRGLFTPCCILLAACVICLAVGYMAGRYDSSSSQTASLLSSTDLLLTGGGTTKDVPVVVAVPMVVADATKQAPVCFNTCKKANDTVCDEGRGVLGGTTQRMHLLVFCDLGTDCADCGPWIPTIPAPWLTNASKGPIKLLVDKGVEVRVNDAKVVPAPFRFAYTDPDKDVDVSFYFQKAGIIEAGITQIFHQIFKNRCHTAADKKRGLFVDVGANFGWYSVFAAAMGCRVIAFEPVPHFHAFLEYTVHLNGLADLVDRRYNVISHSGGGQLMEMVVPNAGIWGTAGIGGLNIDKAIESVNEKLSVPSFTLDELIQEDVLLLKVDVEGWEWSVFKGGSSLMTKYSVENIVLEYSPGVPERNFMKDEIVATANMLVDLSNLGYSIGHLGEVRNAQGGRWWNNTPPPFEEVTRQNLKYDVVDAKRFSNGSLGCPPNADLAAADPYYTRCQSLPEDVNPRGFRSLIDHNTNIWASKNPSLLKLNGSVGIIKPDAPKGQYFIAPGSRVGMGNRACSRLEAEVQVKHRCPCRQKEVCGEIEELVRRVARAGNIASNYVLP